MAGSHSTICAQCPMCGYSCETVKHDLWEHIVLCGGLAGHSVLVILYDRVCGLMLGFGQWLWPKGEGAFCGCNLCGLLLHLG